MLLCSYSQPRSVRCTHLHNYTPSHQTAVLIAVVSGEATPPRLIVKLIPNLAREVYNCKDIVTKDPSHHKYLRHKLRSKQITCNVLPFSVEFFLCAKSYILEVKYNVSQDLGQLYAVLTKLNAAQRDTICHAIPQHLAEMSYILT